MIRFRSMLVPALVAGLAVLPAVHAQDKPVIAVGDALFGCASASDYTRIAGYALAGNLQKFGQGLLTNVASGQCVLFKTDEQVVPTGKTHGAGVTQVRPVTGDATWWTSSKRLHGVKPPLPKHYGKVSTKLYLGKGSNQPLIVGLGGAEGGNAWASDYHSKQRASFLNRGYAFLALAYFQRRPGTPLGIPSPTGIPKTLDRISLNGIHKAIREAARNPKINARCIAVMAGSRGAELALLLASHFKDIKAVVAMAPSDVAYMGTKSLLTSGWMYNGKPVAHVRFDGRALPALLQRDIKKAMQISRADDPNASDALIAVQDINGPILFMSGIGDQLWDSTRMSNHMMQELAKANYPYEYQHLATRGKHDAPEHHLAYALRFLDRNFMTGNTDGCPRTP